MQDNSKFQTDLDLHMKPKFEPSYLQTTARKIKDKINKLVYTVKVIGFFVGRSKKGFS